MLGYIARRILLAIPIAFGVSVVCFSLVYLAPGDPLQTILPSDATQEMVAQIKHAYGFDRPLPVQYLLWLGHVLTGDFGVSISTRRPVILEVTGALSNTFMLTSFAVPSRSSSGTRWAPIAGCFPGRAVDRVVTGAAVVGVSLPNYWLGIVLVIIFAVELMALPATGMGPQGSAQFSILRWSDAQYLVLPVITLSMIPVGIIARTTRAAVAEVLNQDFVTTLRAKGLSEIAVIRHVLKNSAPQVLAVMGLAVRLPDGRLDPGGDRVHLAGQRLHAVEGDHQPRHPGAAGNHPVPGDDLRRHQPGRRSPAIPDRPAHPPELSDVADRHAPHRRPDDDAPPALRVRGYWGSWAIDCATTPSPCSSARSCC